MPAAAQATEQVAIEAIVGVGEEDALAAIGTLGDVVRESGHDEAGNARHGRSLAECVAPVDGLHRKWSKKL